MRFLEVRRHSLTKKGEGRGQGSHLSQEGVALARELGEHAGPFDLVLTSLIPRTLETALAMGFAVDRQIEALGEIPPTVVDEIGHHDRWTWPQPFVQFASFVSQGGPTSKMANRQRALWQSALEEVPDNGRVLVISHGRVIESGLVACLPHGDFANWGHPFAHTEGFRLSYDQGEFTGVELLRLQAG